MKTSGKRGLHVYVPIERRYGFDALRAFTLGVARLVAERRPDAYTIEMRKADRGGRLLIDWSRAGEAQTLVAAWSPRATPTATVSTPLSWAELDGPVDPAAFTLPGVLERPDPWAGEPVAPQRLEDAAAALVAAGVELEVISPRARTSAPRTRRRVEFDRQAPDPACGGRSRELTPHRRRRSHRMWTPLGPSTSTNPPDCQEPAHPRLTSAERPSPCATSRRHAHHVRGDPRPRCCELDARRPLTRPDRMVVDEQVWRGGRRRR